MHLLRLATLAVTSSMLACAAPATSELAESCGATCDETGDTINGLPAEDYFGLMTYAVDQESLAPFRYLAAWGPRLSLGDGVDATAELYLLEDGEFYLYYEEWERVSPSESHQLADELVQGQWSIDGVTLVVGDIATGQGVDLGSAGATAPGVALTFTRDITSFPVAGETLTLAAASSTAGLFHILGKQDDGVCEPRFGEFCSYSDDCGPCICGDGLCQDTFSWGESHVTCPADCLD